MLLSMGALVAVGGEADGLAETDAGFIPARHLAPLDQAASDWVEVATRFLGTPYLWGGRTSLGLDCSALIQLALAAARIPCPRDSDMQASRLGTAIDHSDPARLDRGDLLFWQGHVGIVLGDGQLLHANGHHMETAIEPLDTAIARIAQAGLPVTGARRVQ
jgi:cell wall-associated NlpC family hydrolase